MSNNLIRDGFTRPGYIEPVEGLHDELRFEFRPMLPEQLEMLDLYRAQNMTDVRKVMSRVRMEVVQRLKNWSEVDDKGDSVPITDGTMAIMHPALWEKLVMVITGRRAVDYDPVTKSIGPDQSLTEQLGN